MAIMESDYGTLVENALTNMHVDRLFDLAKTAKISLYHKMKKAKLIESLADMAEEVLEDMDDYYMNTTVDLFEFNVKSKYIKTATDEEIKQLVRDIIVLVSGYVYGFIGVCDELDMLNDYSDSSELAFEYQEISHYGGRFRTNIVVYKEYGELQFDITFETVWCFDNEDDDIAYETWSLTHMQEVCKFAGDLVRDTKEMKHDIREFSKREINDYVKVFFTQKNNRYNY